MKKKMLLKQMPQTGRSLIEMLGVLALIAILTIGSISVILYGMNKYRANVIIEDVSLMAAAIITNEDYARAAENEKITVAELPEMTRTRSGHPISARRADADSFGVIVEEVSVRVCRLVVMGPNPSRFYPEVNGVLSEEGDTSVCNKPGNRIVFYYLISEDVELCGKKLCPIGFECEEETQACVCPSGRHEEDGQCVCDAGLEECNGRCVEACTGAYMTGFRDENSCLCECDSNLGFEALAQDGSCTCPAGYTLLADQCQKFGCTGGTQGKQNWTCQIDGQRCGYNCFENGTNCEYGYCSATLCPSKQLKYIAAPDLYGCYLSDLSTTCVHLSTTFRCFLDETPCGNGCDASALCYYGECEDNCQTVGLDYACTGSISYGCGCRVQDDVICVKDGTTFTCLNKDNEVCATVCKTRDGQNCAYNACPTSCPEGQIEQTNEDGTTTCVDFCPAGTTYVEYNRKIGCLNADGIFCYLEAGTSGATCSLYGGNSCATGCQLDGTGCKIGTCDEKDCADLGMTWVRTPYYYGCYNSTTDVSCTKVTSWYRCYQGNAQRCGVECTSYYGDNCPECFTNFECPSGGTLVVKERGVRYCKYANGVECRYDTKECTYNNAVCGQGCEMDGTNCTAGECVCPNGQEPVAGSSLMTCQDLGDLTCSEGVCQIGLNPCGTGCDTQGNCSVGVCKAEDCGNLVLQKASYQFYGCYDETQGTICYPNGSTYTCWKNGSLCGDGCTINGTGGTCDTGCV